MKAAKAKYKEVTGEDFGPPAQTKKQKKGGAPKAAGAAPAAPAAVGKGKKGKDGAAAPTAGGKKASKSDKKKGGGTPAPKPVVVDTRPKLSIRFGASASALKCFLAAEVAGIELNTVVAAAGRNSSLKRGKITMLA